MTGIVTGYTHITSTREHVLDVLRLKVPRSLCGASLAGVPGEIGGSPCPECAAIAGWTQCPRCGSYDLKVGLHGWPECEDCGETEIRDA